MPLSGCFSFPIIARALVTGYLQKVSLFRLRFCESCFSLCWNPIFIHIGTFILSWPPNWNFQSFWLYTSFIKIDLSKYRSSVGVLLKICLDNILCCWMEGVQWGTSQCIWSILILSSAIATAFSLTASSLFLVIVNL